MKALNRHGTKRRQRRDGNRPRCFGLFGDPAASRPGDGHRQRHHRRDDHQKNHRLEIRHEPHRAASRFIRWPLPGPSTQWVCTTHALICVNFLPLPPDGIISRPVAIRGLDARQTGRLRRSQPLTGAVFHCTLMRLIAARAKLSRSRQRRGSRLNSDSRGRPFTAACASLDRPPFAFNSIAHTSPEGPNNIRSGQPAQVPIFFSLAAVTISRFSRTQGALKASLAWSSVLMRVDHRAMQLIFARRRRYRTALQRRNRSSAVCRATTPSRHQLVPVSPGDATGPAHRPVRDHGSLMPVTSVCHVERRRRGGHAEPCGPLAIASGVVVLFVHNGLDRSVKDRQARARNGGLSRSTAVARPAGTLADDMTIGDAAS